MRLLPLSRRQALVLSGSVAAASLPSGSTASSAAIPAGTRRIDRDATIADAVMLMPGERFDIASGATLTLTGDLIAPAEQVFFGAGRVDLMRSRVAAARPEWWGAKPDDGTVDSLPALHACLAAHVAMQLGPGDYYLGGALQVASSNRRVWGVGRMQDARGTRLIRRGATGAVVEVGTAKGPASINDFVTGVDMRWIVLGRTAIGATSGGGLVDPPVGLSIRHVLDCRFEGLRAHEHAVGYAINAAVRTYLDDCTAFRSIADGADGDVFVGFDLDGRTTPYAAGGNASLYLIDCNARVGTDRLSQMIGVRMLGTVADTFLIRMETTSLDHGILIDGHAATKTDAQRRAGYADLHIQSPVLDGCRRSGITMSGLSDRALVDIQSPYVGLGSGGQVAISIAQSGGGVSIDGGQLIGWPASVNGVDAVGLLLDRTEGVSAQGLKLLGFPRPVEIARSAGFDVAVAINPRDARGTAPAVRLTECRNGTVRARLAGGGTRHTAGVAIEGRSTRLSIDATGLDAAALSGPAVTVDGRAPVAGGPIVVTGAAIG